MSTLGMKSSLPVIDRRRRNRVRDGYVAQDSVAGVGMFVNGDDGVHCAGCGSRRVSARSRLIPTNTGGHATRSAPYELAGPTGITATHPEACRRYTDAGAGKDREAATPPRERRRPGFRDRPPDRAEEDRERGPASRPPSASR